MASYTLKKGDTLYSIAKQYNTDVASLQMLNSISDPNAMKIGSQLYVPSLSLVRQIESFRKEPTIEKEPTIGKEIEKLKQRGSSLKGDFVPPSLSGRNVAPERIQKEEPPESEKKITKILEEKQRTFTPPQKYQGFGRITNPFDPEVRAQAAKYEEEKLPDPIAKIQEKRKIGYRTEDIVDAIVDTLFLSKAKAFVPEKIKTKENFKGKLLDKSGNAYTTIVDAELKPKEKTISGVVERGQEQQLQWFLNSEPINISNDNKPVYFNPSDPIGFVKEKRAQGYDDVSLLSDIATAIDRHNSVVGGEDAYKLDPFKQSIVWVFGTSPEKVNEFKNYVDKKIFDYQNTSPLVERIERDYNQQEIEDYADYVSTLSSEEKKKEFKKQSSIARNLGISNNYELVRNGVEYLKLQSIYGAGKPILIKEGANTTVDEKVFQYYTSLKRHPRDKEQIRTLTQALNRIRTPNPNDKNDYVSIAATGRGL